MGSAWLLAGIQVVLAVPKHVTRGGVERLTHRRFPAAQLQLLPVLPSPPPGAQHKHDVAAVRGPRTRTGPHAEGADATTVKMAPTIAAVAPCR